MSPIHTVRFSPTKSWLAWHIDLSELQELHDPWTGDIMIGFSYRMRGSPPTGHNISRGKFTEEEWAALCESFFSGHRDLLEAWKTFKETR